jgi:tetratricopeptide (TPR) repeat protein
MAKLAQVQTMGTTSAKGAEGLRSIPRLRTRYYAFLSYSHQDRELADALHRQLERFRVPNAIAGKLTANGVVPRRLTPIFRDEQDLSAGPDLAEEIKAALAASQFLIVLCSPTAAQSRWTNQEIESFKRTRPEGCVLAAIVDGEPFASDLPGREAEECFPPALRFKYDRRGHRTAKRAEPLAADFREGGGGRRLAFLKLVAGMLGIGLDDLVQRDQTRRQRRLAYLAAASIGGMAVTSSLAVAAFEASNQAREERREAEGLVAFMLGDLKDKLEPIGRLDALDGVGARVLAYYSRQDASQLTDAALSQRSQALSLMAQVADSRGDSKTALKLYGQAMAGTAEAMRRNPSNPTAIFDHAQNVFYVGQLAQLGGDLETAENSMREYQRLARQMVALQPDSMKYRMEVEYADTDLGVVLSDRRRFADAVAQFGEALSIMEAISTADPGNTAYRQSVAESLAWLADAEKAVGHYDRAISLRQQTVGLYAALYARSQDVKCRERLVPALRALGNLYRDRGQYGPAEQQLRAAVNEAQALTAVEPGNALWQEIGFRSRIDLAQVLLASGNDKDTAAEVDSAANVVNALLKRGSEPQWRIGLANCLLLRAQLQSRRNGSSGEAVSLAEQAVAILRSAHTVDPVADASRLARAYRVAGDAHHLVGDDTSARAAWEAGLRALPRNVAELPEETAEHAVLLRRLARNDQARPLAAKLDSIGYRLPV